MKCVHRAHNNSGKTVEYDTIGSTVRASCKWLMHEDMTVVAKQTTQTIICAFSKVLSF